MGPSRGIGITKIWLEGKCHSFVSLSDIDEDNNFTVTFQNEKFETKILVLDTKTLIKLAKLEHFMGI